MSDIIGLIPARGGSKALPGKNIRLLGGKPLIAWTVEAAIGSGLLQRIIVSTDDPAIAETARQSGAEVPFLRPAELAQDDSTAIDAALHALDCLATDQPQIVVWLQPTSPFRTAEDIRAGLQLLQESGAPAVMGVCQTKAHPWQVLKISPEGWLESYLENELSVARRQELPPAYQINGALYVNRVESLRRDRTFFPRGTRPYVMPPERSLDIDTAWDFFLAETLLHKQTSS